MAGSALVEVSNFYKTYGKTLAVQGLHFSVGPGEILGFIGPNGAGKTTTLRAVAGVIPPTRGSFHVAGHDLLQDPVAAKRELALVPDNANLFDALTVWEHLSFVAQTYRVEDFEAKAERLLAAFELGEKRNALGGELSRGMRQKVMICCAYLHDPQVILFDEPITGLDPRSIRTLRESILERAAAGAAIIISSHILQWVENLCTHLLLVDRGHMRFFGTLEEARAALGTLDDSLTLEDVFFRITDEAQPPPLPRV